MKKFIKELGYLLEYYAIILTIIIGTYNTIDKLSNTHQLIYFIILTLGTLPIIRTHIKYDKKINGGKE